MRQVNTFISKQNINRIYTPAKTYEPLCTLKHVL